MVAYAMSYNKTYATNQYAGMSPARIVLAMYDGALSAMERAVVATEEGAMGPRGQAIGKAIAIIGELQASLNMTDGGDVAQNLFALYDFAIRELLRANVARDMAGLDACIQVVRSIREGWAQMMEREPGLAVTTTDMNGGYL